MKGITLTSAFMLAITLIFASDDNLTYIGAKDSISANAVAYQFTPPAKIFPLAPNGLIIEQVERSPDDPFGLYDQYPRDKEDVSKRTISSKTFDLGENRYASYFTIGQVAVHYKDEDGNWQDINLQLLSSKDTLYPYYNTTNVYKSYFPGKNITETGVKVDIDGRVLNVYSKQKIYLISRKTQQIYDFIKNKRPQITTPTYFAVKYDFGDEFQSEFRLDASKLHYDIRLSPDYKIFSEFKPEETDLVIEFFVSLPPDVEVWHQNNCKEGRRKQTSDFDAKDYIFLVADGDTIGGFLPSHLFMSHHNPNARYDDIYRIYYPRIIFIDGGIIVRTTIHVSEIMSAGGGSFPVSIILATLDRQIQYNYDDTWGEVFSGTGCANQWQNQEMRLGYYYDGVNGRYYIGGMVFRNITLSNGACVNDADLRITSGPSSWGDPAPGRYPAGYVYAFKVAQSQRFGPCVDGNCNNDAYCYQYDYYPIVGNNCDYFSSSCPCGYQHLAYCVRWGKRTSANNNWTWNFDWARSTRYWCADNTIFAPQPCTLVVKEVTGLSGWVSGNNLTILYGNTFGGSQTDYDYYQQYDYSTTECPLLHLGYTNGVTPNAPSNFTGTATSCSTIVWSWTDNSTNEDGFKIYADGPSADTLLYTTGPNVTSWQDTSKNIHAEVTYNRYVVAFSNQCGGGTSTQSSGSVTPQHCILGYVSVAPNQLCKEQLRIIALRDAKTGAVVKVATADGKIGAADLVDTTNIAASGVRIHTNAGTKAWRSDTMCTCVPSVISISDFIPEFGSRNLIGLPNCEYLLGGSTTLGGGGRNMALVKIRSEGTLEWAYAIGGSSEDSGRAIIKTSDKGYFIIGKTLSWGTNGDILAVKLNSSLSLQWAKAIGISTNVELPYSAIETSDGGYVISAYSPGTQKIFVKLGPSGNLMWCKGISQIIALTFDGCALYPTPDGGFIWTGNYYSSGDDIGVVKFSSDGNIQWANRYYVGSVSTTDMAYGITPTLDNGYIIAGREESTGSWRLLIFKISSTGGVMWGKRISTNLGCGYHVGVGADGNYLISGITGVPNGSSADVAVFKIDNSGNLIWAKSLPNSGVDDIGYSIVNGGDSGIILLSRWSGNGRLIRFDLNGSTCLPSNNENLESISVNSSALNLSPSNLSPTVLDVTPNITPINPGVSTVCP